MTPTRATGPEAEIRDSRMEVTLWNPFSVWIYKRDDVWSETRKQKALLATPEELRKLSSWRNRLRLAMGWYDRDTGGPTCARHVIWVQQGAQSTLPYFTVPLCYELPLPEMAKLRHRLNGRDRKQGTNPQRPRTQPSSQQRPRSSPGVYRQLSGRSKQLQGN